MIKSIKLDKNKKIYGDISIPADKSISHRSIIFASIGDGLSIINNLLEAKDTKKTLNAFRSMGIKIKKKDNKFLVNGKGIYGLSSPQDIIYCGNSGTTMRLLAGLLTGSNLTVTLDGDESLKKRPMDRIIYPLNKMGADINGIKEKYSPLKIKPAKLNGINYKLPIASAQVKSSLLLANIYTNDIIKLSEPKSSRNHTELLMKKLGLTIETKDNLEIIFNSNKIKIPNYEYHIPGDFSQAAYFITAALLIPNSEIVIRDVNLNHTRTGFLEVIKKMGANIEILNRKKSNGEEVGNLLVKHSDLIGININKEIIPRMIDEIPLIAILALKAKGETKINSASELRVKESDRLYVLKEAFKKLNLKFEVFEDGFKIRGPQKIKGNVEIDTFKDHRMAMTFSILSLITERGLKLIGAECISNSFPNFYKKINEVIK